MSLYMALAPDEKITYKEGGPAALTAFEAGAEGFETKAFRGCGIVTSDPFEVSDGKRARFQRTTYTFKRRNASQKTSIVTHTQFQDEFILLR